MNCLIKNSMDNIKLNFVWKKLIWITLRKDRTLEQISVTLLDLNEDCLRHIGYHLSIEDTYSLGHTCTKLFGIVSKIRANVTITNLNQLKYLNYFGPAARTINVDMLAAGRFTENEQRNLLTILGKCTNISDLTLKTADSKILGSAFVSNRSIRQLVYLRIYLMKLSKFYRPNFVESMRKCENLRGLFIKYSDTSRHLYTAKQLLATEFPKLKFLEVDGRLSEEYLEAIVLFRKLEKIELQILSNDKKLIPKLLILNKLPVLKYTKLTIHTKATEQMAPILRQIQSLKELSITCTLFEYFIGDIFQIRQITSLTLSIELHERTFSETIKQLRYHEQSLSNLTNLNISEMAGEIRHHWTTSKDLNEFIKFVINCPRIKSIAFPMLFPIHRLYKQLLKYEKNFGYHVRKKALHLTIMYNQWIPGYSNGKRTHNVIIESIEKEHLSIISRIFIYAMLEICQEITSVLLCLFFLLIGKLIHVIQNVIV